MTYKIETLTMEQLDLVAGGSSAQTDTDKGFFKKLGYNMNAVTVEDAFRDNGIMFNDSCFGDNDYVIFMKSSGEWCLHPHWAALGLVLARSKYPGFNGNWTDGKYVQSFLKEHFHVQSFG